MSKRIVLHSDVDILSLVTTHSIDIKNLQTNMTKNRGEIQTVQNEVATMKKGLATKGNCIINHNTFQGTNPSGCVSGFPGYSQFAPPIDWLVSMSEIILKGTFN